MPRVDMGTSETGWGCSCRAFRRGEPNPERAAKALARAAVVTVEDLGTDGAYHRFRAWTEPDSRYEVACGPGQGGFCKHVLACLFVDHPWLRQAALGASDIVEQNTALEKENKKLKKEIAQCQKTNK